MVTATPTTQIPNQTSFLSILQRLAKMGSIKDRNGMDLTEAEDIKKRCKAQDI